MTYQSASGAGAKQVHELIQQNTFISKHITTEELNPNAPILPLVKKVTQLIKSPELPTDMLGAPLSGSIIPWIDSDLGDGNSREEWKGEAETNKILGLAPKTIQINGLCIRVGVICCHSAAITMKLKHEISEKEFADLSQNAHQWVNYIPNNKSETLNKLTPAAISGTLKIGVGRFKKLSLGNEPIYSVLTIGDQLLWGAAEPLRRVLKIIYSYNRKTLNF